MEPFGLLRVRTQGLEEARAPAASRRAWIREAGNALGPDGTPNNLVRFSPDVIRSSSRHPLRDRRVPESRPSWMCSHSERRAARFVVKSFSTAARSTAISTGWWVTLSNRTFIIPPKPCSRPWNSAQWYGPGLRQDRAYSLTKRPAQCRLPHSIPKKEKLKFARSLLRLLGLEAQAHAIIGNNSQDGLSADQRKRVTIGVEMAADPAILFLDEVRDACRTMC